MASTRRQNSSRRHPRNFPVIPFGFGESIIKMFPVFVGVLSLHMTANSVHCSDHFKAAESPGSEGEGHVVVHTRYGKILGRRVNSNFQIPAALATSTVDRFLGIPYAKPPLQDLRFQAPHPPDKWSGTLNATHFSNICPQGFAILPDRWRRDEDCLYLNIYTPYKTSSESSQSYPVMVFIHGGSYEVGTGNVYDGLVLAQFGVVVITINYRLGALGFLTSGSLDLPGNYGILDQIESLKWIKENIAAFRGDPTKVTVFGQSAGGASVGLLMTSPLAKGLFHRVIAQSGSALASYSIHNPALEFKDYIEDVFRLFGCHQKSRAQRLKCLRSCDWQTIMRKRGQFPRHSRIEPEFKPVIDGAVLPGEPKLLLDKGQFTRVPFMAGTVENEFGNYFNGGLRYKIFFDEALDSIVSKVTGNQESLFDVIEYEYSDWRKSRNINNENRDYDRGMLLSDMNMVAPTVLISSILASHGVPVYQYHFAVNNSFHSMDLNYVFGSPFSGTYMDEMFNNGGSNFSDADRKLSLIMMTSWTHFAIHGDPSPRWTNPSTSWHRFTSEDKEYLHMTSNGTRMRKHLRADKVAFWNILLPRLKSSVISRRSRGDVMQPKLFALIGVAIMLFIICLAQLVALVRLKNENVRYSHVITASRPHPV